MRICFSPPPHLTYRLVQDNKIALLHFSPVYYLPGTDQVAAPPSTVSDRRARLRGIISTVIRIETLLQSIISHDELEISTAALVALYDEVPGNSSGSTAFGSFLGCIATHGVPPPSHATPTMSAEAQLAAAARIADAPTPVIQKVIVAQRALTLIVTPVPQTVDDVFESGETLAPELVLGIVMSAVVSAAICAAFVCSVQTSSLQMHHRFQTLMLESKLRNEILHANAEHAAALSARSDVLAFVCHELRNPLNAVYGMAQLMMAGGEDARGEAAASAESISCILHASELMSAILNDVLDYTRLERSGLKLERRMFNFRSQVEDVLRCASVLKKPRVTISASMGQGCPELVWGDSTRVAQLLWNLLSNACKFTHSGGTISVLAEALPPKEAAQAVQHECAVKRQVSGDAIVLDVQQSGLDDVEMHTPAATASEASNKLVGVRITVADNGIGIASEELEQLTTPYVQANVSIARKHGGTGLGLAISKGLAALMHGSITLRSAGWGLGTTASVDLYFERVDGTPGVATKTGVFNTQGSTVGASKLYDAVLLHATSSAAGVTPPLTGPSLARRFASEKKLDESLDSSSCSFSADGIRNDSFRRALRTDSNESDASGSGGMHSSRSFNATVLESGDTSLKVRRSLLHKRSYPLLLRPSLGTSLGAASAASAASEALTTDTTVHEATPPSFSTPPPRPFRFLVVDDQAVNRRIIVRMLARSGLVSLPPGAPDAASALVEVSEAVNGAEALKAMFGERRAQDLMENNHVPPVVGNVGTGDDALRPFDLVFMDMEVRTCSWHTVHDDLCALSEQ